MNLMLFELLKSSWLHDFIPLSCRRQFWHQLLFTFIQLLFYFSLIHHLIGNG